MYQYKGIACQDNIDSSTSLLGLSHLVKRCANYREPSKYLSPTIFMRLVDWLFQKYFHAKDTLRGLNEKIPEMNSYKGRKKHWNKFCPSRNLFNYIKLALTLLSPKFLIETGTIPGDGIKGLAAWAQSPGAPYNDNLRVLIEHRNITTT